MKQQKPIIFLILKILAPLFLAVAITGIVLSVKGFGDFESNNFMVGGMLATFGIFLTAICAIFGFSPEIRKLSIKTQKYQIEENKQDLTDIANATADITKGAVKTTASAVKDGFTEPTEPQMYCKHCGAQIDANSRFCKVCGKEQ